MTERYVDNTILDHFRKCPRMHYFFAIRHWRPEKTAHDLVFGLCAHAAMDVVWDKANSNLSDLQIIALAMKEFMKEWDKAYPKPEVAPQEQEGVFFVDTLKEDLYPKTPERFMEILKWYLVKKREWLSKITIIGIELPFVVPLGAENSTEFMYCGRKDKVYRDPLLANKVCIADHKTTKSGKTQWMNSYEPNDQVDGYIYDGVMTYGPDEFFGCIIDGILVQKGSAKDLFDPTLPPGIGFPNLRMQRTEEMLEAWLWDVLDLLAELKNQEENLASCKPGDRILKAFPHKKVACGYFKSCIYRKLCIYHANPMQLEEVPIGFKEEVWDPIKRINSNGPNTDMTEGDD